MSQPIKKIMLILSGALLVLCYQNCGETFSVNDSINDEITSKFESGAAEYATNIADDNLEVIAFEKAGCNNPNLTCYGILQDTKINNIAHWVHPTHGPGILIKLFKGQSRNGYLPGDYYSNFRVRANNKLLFVSHCGDQSQTICNIFVNAKRFQKGERIEFSIGGTSSTNYGNRAEGSFVVNYACDKIDDPAYCANEVASQINVMDTDSSVDAVNEQGNIEPEQTRVTSTPAPQVPKGPVLGHHFIANGLAFMYLGHTGLDFSRPGNGHNCRLDGESQFEPQKEIPRPADVVSLNEHISCRSLSYNVVAYVIENQSSQINGGSSLAGKVFKADGLYWVVVNTPSKHCRLRNSDKIKNVNVITKPAEIKLKYQNNFCGEATISTVFGQSAAVHSGSGELGKGVYKLRFNRYGQSGEVFWENPTNVRWVVVRCNVNERVFVKSFGKGERSFFIADLGSSNAGSCTVVTAYQDGRRTVEKSVKIPKR